MTELIDGPGVKELLGVTSRQLHAWQSRRATTGFPEEIAWKSPEMASRGGVRVKSMRLWDKEEVLEWHRNYKPATGGGARHKLPCNCPTHRHIIVEEP